MSDTAPLEVSSLLAHENDHGPTCAICASQVQRGRAAIAADPATFLVHAHKYAPAGMRRVPDWQVVEETWEALLVCSCGFMEWRRAPRVPS